jgi:undecaprenyl-diphosphatase
VLPPRELNISIYQDVNRFARQSPWAHGFMHAYALWLGPVALVMAFVFTYAILWWRRDVRGTALMGLGGIGTLLALGINQLVGHAARELRPYDTLPHVLVLVPRTNDYAFPSDHSVLAGALLTSVLLVAWRPALPGSPAAVRRPGPVVLAGITVVAGLFLCFARVYVGAHYPGDVVAGLLLGAGVVLIVALLGPLAYRIAEAIEPTPLALVARRPRSGRGQVGARPAADVVDT